MNSHGILTPYEWLSLEPVSAGNWLVADLGEHRLTGDGVIGLIQLFLGIFETLRRNARLGGNEAAFAVLYDRFCDANLDTCVRSPSSRRRRKRR